MEIIKMVDVNKIELDKYDLVYITTNNYLSLGIVVKVTPNKVIVRLQYGVDIGVLASDHIIKVNDKIVSMKETYESINMLNLKQRLLKNEK